MFNLYPLLIAVIGLAISMALLEPAVRRLPPDAKSLLMDAFQLTRWLNLAGALVFVLLVLWRLQVAWIFLGVSYLALMIFSLLRLRSLALPAEFISRMSLALAVRTIGLVACSAIYALRQIQ
jgi:hypothetical protein